MRVTGNFSKCSTSIREDSMEVFAKNDAKRQYVKISSVECKGIKCESTINPADSYKSSSQRWGPHKITDSQRGFQLSLWRWSPAVNVAAHLAGSQNLMAKMHPSGFESFGFSVGLWQNKIHHGSDESPAASAQQELLSDSKDEKTVYCSLLTCQTTQSKIITISRLFLWAFGPSIRQLCPTDLPIRRSVSLEPNVRGAGTAVKHGWSMTSKHVACQGDNMCIICKWDAYIDYILCNRYIIWYIQIYTVPGTNIYLNFYI